MIYEFTYWLDIVLAGFMIVYIWYKAVAFSACLIQCSSSYFSLYDIGWSEMVVLRNIIIQIDPEH